MSEIKTKIRTYNDVIDLFGEEKAADMLSEALDWSALSMALDNELSTSWAYLDALSSQCAEICNKFAGYIESAGLARGVLVPGEYELDHDALNADVSERFNIQYGFQCDQMIDAMQFDMTLILTEKVDSMAFSPAGPSRIRRNSMPSSMHFRSTRLRTTRYQIKSAYSSCLSRCTGRMTHLRLSRRISVSRTPAVLPSTIALRSPAIPRMNSWT